MRSKHIKILVDGLKAAQQTPREWTEIASASGISRSTIVKIAAGENTGIKIVTFEKLYEVLAHRGHLDSTFVYVVAA